LCHFVFFVANTFVANDLRLLRFVSSEPSW
jgi:hypothetical protein